jgi:hypothetical protein
MPGEDGWVPTGQPVSTVIVTLSPDALQGLHQRDTVGARAADGRQVTLDPQQFTAEELEALAEAATVRKRDGATVLAIVLRGYEPDRTVFQDVYAALVSSGQVWHLEPREDHSVILLVDHGVRHLVTVHVLPDYDVTAPGP